MVHSQGAIYAGCMPRRGGGGWGWLQRFNECIRLRSWMPSNQMQDMERDATIKYTARTMRVLTHKNFLGTVEKAFQKEIIRLLAFATHPHLSSSHAQQSKPAESMVRYEALALGIILSIDAADACSCSPDFWEKTMCERAQDHDLVVHGTAVNRFVLWFAVDCRDYCLLGFCSTCAHHTALFLLAGKANPAQYGTAQGRPVRGRSVIVQSAHE